MLGVTDYGAFVIAFIIVLAIPGPGNFALITATGKGGIKAGMAATCGVILGDQVLLWLALPRSMWCSGRALRTWPTWGCACC